MGLDPKNKSLTKVELICILTILPFFIIFYPFSHPPSTPLRFSTVPKISAAVSVNENLLRERFSEANSAAIFRQLMVAHRDIKPDNILFDSRGRVKLADFGSTETFEAVRRGNLRFPPQIFRSVSPEAKDLLWKMICRDVSRRLSAEQVVIARQTNFPNAVVYWQVKKNRSKKERRPVKRNGEGEKLPNKTG